MTQLYPFRTQYMQDNFSRIITMCKASAYDEKRFTDTILPALITGLAACDGAYNEGMTLDNIPNAALNLHIDVDNIAVLEAFSFGAAIAINQSIRSAIIWMLPDTEDYERIAEHRSRVENADVSIEDTRTMLALDAVLALIDSYIDDPTDKDPSDAHPAAQ